MGICNMSYRFLGICQRSHFLFRAVFLSVAVVLILGCGSSELPRAIVEGNVTYKCSPIQEGMILFYPVEGTPGPVSSAPIKLGQYTVTNKEGVPIGKHRVVIEGYEAPPPGSDPDTGLVQYLPQKYNKQSDLTAEVPPGESQVVRNFELNP
jgi:hypothetical protein